MASRGRQVCVANQCNFRPSGLCVSNYSGTALHKFSVSHSSLEISNLQYYNISSRRFLRSKSDKRVTEVAGGFELG